ncbi:MAG: dihydrolipoyl dehydrogenase [Candidatus Cyclobacteriaceae bacterium M2_1C_046]
MDKKELIVIGAGPGGYAAAFRAADLGVKVTLIDPEENPGGVCLYRGCIPSKALLHVAKIKQESAEAKKMGLSYKEPKVELKKMREWKDGVVNKLTGGLGSLSKARKIEYIRGYTSFKDEEHVVVEQKGEKKKTLTFKNCIIATGSVPLALPDTEFDGKKIISSKHALDIKKVPKKLLIIGGGYIGLELGTVYAQLGSKVTIAEMMDNLLPGVDRELVKPLKKKIKSMVEKVHLKTQVEGIKKNKEGVKVSYKKKDKSKSATFDQVLIAIGRKPLTEGLKIKAAGVKLTEKGFIEVDKERRTSNSKIFAIGDVTGDPMLAHKASYEGKVAAEVIAGKESVYEPRAIPAVVYTSPEIAWAGYTEEQAKKEARDIEVTKYPMSASGRALTLGTEKGLTKLIFDKHTHRLLGVGITAPNAGELIAELVLAIEMAAVQEDFEHTIHPHPTLSETILEAAEMLKGQSIHYKG